MYSAPRARGVRAGQQLRGARRVGAPAVRAVPPLARAAARRLLRAHALDLVTAAFLPCIRGHVYFRCII